MAKNIYIFIASLIEGSNSNFAVRVTLNSILGGRNYPLTLRIGVSPQDGEELVLEDLSFGWFAEEGEKLLFGGWKIFEGLQYEGRGRFVPLEEGDTFFLIEEYAERPVLPL